MPRPVRRQILVLIAACLFGAGVTIAAYWPGFMTWDAIRQYDQTLNGDFDDWHPPMMEWVWRRFLGLTPGPAPMLLLQLALEWSGLALFGGWALRERRPWLAAAAVACGFLPFALALTAWIDGVAGAAGATPPGWPAVWIALALGLLCVAPALPSRRIVTALALSAAAYGLGYLLFGVASELRYHLWTMLATALAGTVAVADLGAGAAVSRRRLVLAGAIPAAVLLASCAERLLSTT